MLIASQSAYDGEHAQLWLQTVFDVSSSLRRGNGTDNGETFAMYLKQYDASSASLLNVIADVPSTAVLAAYDGRIWAVGDCNNSSSSTFSSALKSKCLWSINGREAFQSLHLIALPRRWDQIMPGVSALLGSKLYVILHPPQT